MIINITSFSKYNFSNNLLCRYIILNVCHNTTNYFNNKIIDKYLDDSFTILNKFRKII